MVVVDDVATALDLASVVVGTKDAAVGGGAVATIFAFVMVGVATTVVAVASVVLVPISIVAEMLLFLFLGTVGTGPCKIAQFTLALPCFESILSLSTLAQGQRP